ncbi:hypothetical protein BH24ACI5_BH24ACI5_24930 [soil metagenome]
MANWRTAFPSKFYQAADLDVAVTRTIREVKVEPIGDNQEIKLVASFEEPGSKRLILNATRAEAVEEIAGTSDADKWSGVAIMLTKGSTRFQGKKTACIVVSAPLAADAVGF